MKMLYWEPHTTKEGHLRRLRERLETIGADKETWAKLEPEKLNRHQLEALQELADKAFTHGMRTKRNQP